MANWYVDNVNGNDANSGASEALAKATIAAGIALTSAGDKLYVQAGANYSHAATVTINKKGDTTTGRITIEGYTTTPGARDGRPVITSATNGVPIFTASDADYVTLRHVAISHTAATRGHAIDGASTVSQNMILDDVIIDGCQKGIVDGFGMPDLSLIETEIKNCVSYGIHLDDNGDLQLFGCNIHDNGGDGVRIDFCIAVNTVTIDNTVLKSNAGYGMINSYSTTQAKTVVRNSTVRANGGGGLGWTNSLNVPHLALDNNVIYGNTGYGVTVACTATACAATIQSNRNNAYGANTTAARNGLPVGYADLDAIADPFVSASDSALAGGSALRNAGYPGKVNGNATVGYADIGALRHQDPSVSCDYPAVGNVRSGVSYNNGGSVGTLTLPVANDVQRFVAYGAGGVEFTGNFYWPDPAAVQTGVGYGASGTEFVGTYGGGGGTIPAFPTLNVTDRADGTGANLTVSGATAGSNNEIYRAAIEPGPLAWTLTGTVVGNGSLGANVQPFAWLWQARSAIGPAVTTGTTFYRPTTGAPAGGPWAYDRRDGTGINVIVSGTGGVTYTAQIRDTSQTNWRDAGSIVGSGLLVIPAGPEDSSVTVDRTYAVRLSYPGGVSGDLYVTPTDGLESDIFPAIIAVKHELIKMNLPRIGGNVFHCIDPRDSIVAIVPNQPAAWVFQPSEEEPTAIDNQTTRVSYPIEIGFSNHVVSTAGADLSWWCHVRYKVFWHFHRIATSLMGPNKPYRKWTVGFGAVLPDDPQKYEFAYKSLRLTVDAERQIGGI